MITEVDGKVHSKELFEYKFHKIGATFYQQLWKIENWV